VEMEHLEKEGYSAEAARRQAMLAHMGDFLPVMTLASEFAEEIYPVARVYRDVRSFTELDDLFARMGEVPIRDRWDRLTSQSLTKRLNAVVFELSKGIWKEAQGNPETFFARRRSKIRALHALQQQMRQITPANFHPFTVLSSALEDLFKAD
jgi:glutamate dehydrogenase